MRDKIKSLTRENKRIKDDIEEKNTALRELAQFYQVNYYFNYKFSIVKVFMKRKMKVIPRILRQGKHGAIHYEKFNFNTIIFLNFFFLILFFIPLLLNSVSSY